MSPMHAFPSARRIALAAALGAACCAPAPAAQATPGAQDDAPMTCAKSPDPARDGQRDFDFEHGDWKTELKVLESPLSGTANWLQFQGTSRVSQVLGGRANLVELEVTGPTGRIEGLSLRLYDPKARQWSLHFANIRSGVLTTPVIGAFADGCGEFYGTDTVDGRSILVRFVIKPLSRDIARFEQAYSADGGRTWEVNWIAVDTRMQAE
jgi:hypothetical protein